MKKQKPIKPQGPWIITSYSDIQYPGTENEFDAGYIEFKHDESNMTSHHEMDWLRGDRAYLGKTPPTLLDVWSMLLRDTPGTIGFMYRKTKDHTEVYWHVTRKNGCFKYVLADMTKHPPEELCARIEGDFSPIRSDMASFLHMLDGLQEDCEVKVAPIINLDEMRKKKEA